MDSKHYAAIFKSFENGYYTFIFEDGVEMVFEELHPKILSKYNLNTDITLIDCLFNLSFSEILADDEDDLVIYRIEFLELINTN